MPSGKTKTVNFNMQGVQRIPNDKPALYRILNQAGQNIYTGVAKRGRVRERLAEHLPRGREPIPGGVKAQIEQHRRIADAEQKEGRVVARSRPRHNIQGK